MSINQFLTFRTLDEITEPLLLEFMAAIGDWEYLDFENVIQRNFMKFWPYIQIHRHEDGDFAYVFYGTHMVENFGVDRTGSKVSEISNHIRKNEFLNMLLDVLTTKKPIYAVGDLKIDGREHKKWQQVKMPLQLNDEINEVLAFIVFAPY